MQLPARTQPPLDGSTPICGAAAGAEMTVLDFWRYSYSDLLLPTIRGDLAEFLVMRASLPAEQQAKYYAVRKSGDVVDFWLDKNQWVEVKSSAYLQSWDQNQLSKITFDVRKREGWDFKKRVKVFPRQRWAHLYVLCYLHCSDKSKVNPLNVDHWTFFVVPTKLIDARFGDRESISLRDVQERLAIQPTPYACLGKIVRDTAARLAASTPGGAC